MLSEYCAHCTYCISQYYLEAQRVDVERLKGQDIYMFVPWPLTRNAFTEAHKLDTHFIHGLFIHNTYTVTTHIQYCVICSDPSLFHSLLLSPLSISLSLSIYICVCVCTCVCLYVCDCRSSRSWHTCSYSLNWRHHNHFEYFIRPNLLHWTCTKSWNTKFYPRP